MEHHLAVTPNTDEAFLREVDEELRRDELATLWTRYGRWFLAAVVLGLAILGGAIYWRHHETEVAGEQGEKLQKVYDALLAQNVKAATPPLDELAASKIAGYRAMARFTQADMFLQKKDQKGAAAKFAEIAGDATLGQPFRDLALIRQTAVEFDMLQPQVVVDRLRPLAVQGGPWFGSAGELVGAAYLRMNKPDRAAGLFGQIANDETVPESIRNRAIMISETLGAQAPAHPEEKKAQ